ncbi:MAG TPA: HDOD domain-containing protein [Candidatus Eisenbacteria bacterium]|nr:HDOD domain-containing protein [Candidatus Eisenbacteria bacterium]
MLNDLYQRRTLDGFLDRIQGLPPAPQILVKLLRALNEPDTDVSRVVDLISFDPALTANVLKLCNSPAFAAAEPIKNIHEAVGRLGLQVIYRLVAATSSRGVFRLDWPVPGFTAETLWKHSVTVALAAQLISKDIGEDDGGVFTAALLHDTGKVLMSKAFKRLYSDLLPGAIPDPGCLAREEETRFTFDHAAAGGRLLERWKFPEQIVAGVTFHHRPERAAPFQRVAACIALGDTISYLLEKPADAEAAAAHSSTDALGILGLVPEALLLYLERTRDNLKFVQALCAS